MEYLKHHQLKKTKKQKPYKRMRNRAIRFNTRTKALEFDRITKLEIFKRDKGRCILTKRTDNLTYAHLIPRSKNGLGILQNGALITWEVHQDMDVNENRVSQKDFRSYMDNLYPLFKDEDRKYKKY
jgi:5-methylcytosine-specific restriction endonuclease McrA